MEGRSGARLQPQIDRLWSDLEHISTFRDLSRPGWTRRAFSPEYLAARQWLRERMEQAGLTTSFDAAANLIGRREGRRNDLDPIMIGSHTDTVDGGGRFDGTVGVLAGIEIARCLEESGTMLDHPLEIIDFLAAEPGEWGEWHLGVRAIVGQGIGTRELGGRLPDGRTVADGIIAVGGQLAGRRPDYLEDVVRQAGSVAVYLELHVEQGPTLDADHVPLGVVTELPEAWDFRLQVASFPLTPLSAMREVRTQLLAAADEVAAAVQEIWQSAGWLTRLSRKVDLYAETAMTIDLRVEMQRHGSTDGRWPLPMVTFRDRFNDIVQRRKLQGTEQSTLALGTTVSGIMQTLLSETAADLGVLARPMSGPMPHAANWMSWITPVGMLLLPSKGGISHHPDEMVEPEHIRRGTMVLGEALLRIDERLMRGQRLRPHREWRLLDRDRNWLGTFLVTSIDQPWFIGNFEAQPAFEAIRPLFDDEFRLLNDERLSDEGADWSQIDGAFERIEALDLRLECVETGEYYTRPFMHINGRRAQLRNLPDNWREVDEARNRAKTDG